MAGSKPGHDDVSVQGYASPKKVPPFDGTSVLSLSLVQFRSGPNLTSALPLLVGVLALTIRILLLLSGLLATALLLARLLAPALVLLPRSLVLLTHKDLPRCT